MQFELLSSLISIFSSETNHAQVKKEKKKELQQASIIKAICSTWALGTAEYFLEAYDSYLRVLNTWSCFAITNIPFWAFA